MKWLIIVGLIACTRPNRVSSMSDDCWENRKTVKQLETVTGVVIKESDWVYILLPPSKQLFPCNLPDSFQMGDSVLFSANQKETFPNERWAGDPIELTHIELK